MQIIYKTSNSPEVKMCEEENYLEISGESYPVNPIKFYEPVFKWSNEILLFKNEISLIFKFDYLNTTSSKILMDILDISNDFHKKGKKITINWFYKKNDEDMLEMGQEFESSLDLPFIIKEM
jgi:hypothetical protein